MPDCKSCANKRHHVEPVPYIEHESCVARQERNNIRSFVVSIILLVILLTSIAFCYKTHIDSISQLEKINQQWIDYINQYDFESYTYKQDGAGVNIIGDGNGVDFDVSESHDKAEN